jgi:hypothetical protein
VIVRRYEEGLTIREIAMEQRLLKTTVQDALARGGTTIREQRAEHKPLAHSGLRTPDGASSSH